MSSAGIPGDIADGDAVLTEVQVDAMANNNGYLTSVDWGDIGSMPSGFSDGVDNDTQLSEAEVDAMAGDNGYLTSSSSVAWSRLTGVPGGFADGVDNDTNTQLSEATVDSYANNNGYASTGTAIARRSCVTSGYVNSMDAVLNYTCPGNKVIGGLYSYHNNGTEDRQWRITCCELYIP